MEDVARIGQGRSRGGAARAEGGLWARVLRYWFPAAVIYAFITVLSSIPGKRFPSVPIWNIDKGVHLVAYAPIGFFVARALVKTTALGPGSVLVATVAISAAAGGLDELHQKYVPFRRPDWRDLVAVIAGGALGALDFLLLRGRARRRRAAAE